MTVCLLITTLNRTSQLQNSLNRLAELTLPDEVLIVDDGGEDEALSDMCDQMSDRLPMRYLFHSHPGESLCSEARNVGIKNTDCDIIITSEPEILFETDVIDQMLFQHELNHKDVISAGTIHHEQQGGGVTTIEGWVAPFTALYRRDWLIEVGGWDETFPSPWGWEDTDLLTRLRAAGHGQVIDREIVVRHQWHPPRTCNQGPNESHFFAKDLQISTEHIVANLGREWGVIRP